MSNNLIANNNLAPSLPVPTMSQSLPTDSSSVNFERQASATDILLKEEFISQAKAGKILNI